MKALLHSRKLLAVLLLVVVGLLKLPLEQRLADELRAQDLIEEPVRLGMMENLGQMGMAAALGGLRSLVASVTYLMAYSDFEDVNWEGVRNLMWLTTELEPHARSYWEESSWHMAYNAASYYLRDEQLRPPIREKLYRDHVKLGIDILEEGLHYLPGNPYLLQRLALTYKDRVKDHRKAAEAFLACYEHGGRRFEYAERMGAYELTQLDDRASWEKAYKILKHYYDIGMRKKGTTIMTDLPILEERLNIPADQRVKALPNDIPPSYSPNLPKSTATHSSPQK